MTTTDKIMALANTYAGNNGKALLEKLYGSGRCYTEQCAAEALKDREALRTEIEKLVRDAERWRTFLGTRPANTHDVICEAIDAAMEKQS